MCLHRRFELSFLSTSMCVRRPEETCMNARLLAGDAAAGDWQHRFEECVIAGNRSGGVAVERQSVHDDVERAEAVEHVLGDREGAVVVQVALVVSDGETLEREAARGGCVAACRERGVDRAVEGALSSRLIRPSPLVSADAGGQTFASPRIPWMCMAWGRLGVRLWT